MATPAALAEPRTPVSRKWTLLLVLANLGIWMAFMAPLQVLLPDQIQDISPDDKKTLLGWVTGAGALAALLVTPLVGALSDRTTSRLGRRRPWTVTGALLSAVSLAALARQDTIAGVAVAWVFVQAGLNMMLASLTAAVPDRVPVRQRGLVSGWVNLPQVLGAVLGVAVVSAIVPGRSGYVALGLAVVGLALPFVLLTTDDPLPPAARPPLRTVWRGMWISPRRHPDFGWAWASRFVTQLSGAAASLYLLYFLEDSVKVKDADEAVLQLTAVTTLCLLVTIVLGGYWSDRLGRRKVFVLGAGAVLALASVVMAVSPTWPAAVLAAAILGAGFGVYLAVHSALVTEVLPSAVDRAKDMGLVNVANTAPNLLAPVVAGPVVSLMGYPALFALSAVLTLGGSALVLRIRSVA
ncbi:MAG TPA: MFS transporter [Streptomyces sp.]|uniref:MFS transporter n=1 Tax=Streptomyces sp. TaxID=1931 RepID=UPI002D6AE815|nr:MFS transporter [Streptomyces sp.]HZG07175.1 MFS transporter [Streptomyces sp.]